MANKVTLPAKILQDALKIIAPAVSNRNILPILSCVKIDVSEQSISLMSNDSSMIITHELNFEHQISQTVFSIGIEFAKLKAVVDVSGDNEISITEQDVQFYITNERDKFYIPKENLKDFLSVPKMEKSSTLVVPNGFTASLLNGQDSLEKSSSMRGLEHFCIHLQKGSITVVAIDSNGGYLKKFESENIEEGRLIIPNTICRALGVFKTEASQVLYSNDWVCLKNEDSAVYIKTVDNRYPDYWNFVPKEKVNATAHITDVLAAIESAVAIWGTKEIAPALLATVKNNTVDIEVNDIDHSSSGSSWFAIDNHSAEELSYKILYSYAKRTLNQLKREGSECEIQFCGLNKPIVFYIKEKGVTGMIVPMVQQNN